MKLSGWGRYPRIDAQIIAPADLPALAAGAARLPPQTIARGLGRSYGDSALAATVIDTRHLDHFITFDATSGVLVCQSGATLAEILAVAVPQGWFLPVTPGTRFVTLGGAIASDVHGKNHHLHGSFCDYIQSLRLFTASAGIVHCARDAEPELFAATCGGMGLTGVIVEASLQLKPIAGAFIEQTSIKAANLDAAFELFEAHGDASYSVAWIDCLAQGDNLGRAIVSLGEHASSGELSTGSDTTLSAPFTTPGWLLNNWSMRAFNYLYYHRMRDMRRHSRVHYVPFFYPLDGIRHWNRLYGGDGFVQYQCVLPRAAGREGMAALLQCIAASGKGSFLAVLKALGKGNGNLLSFPMEGYTLALDFRMERDILPLLDELDAMVIDHGGRIYLTKDARMSQATFRACYPNWNNFCEIRRAWGADKHFNSLQSQRLGL